jgi:hypothetical protein
MRVCHPGPVAFHSARYRVAGAGDMALEITEQVEIAFQDADKADQRRIALAYH